MTQKYNEPMCSECGKKMVHEAQWTGCVHWHCKKCGTTNWPAGLVPTETCPVCGVINTVDWVVMPSTNGKLVKYQGLLCRRCGKGKRLKLPMSIIKTCHLSAEFALKHKDCKGGL